eukprot:10901042-Lingulodinium_polyedra.AAC.1
MADLLPRADGRHSRPSKTATRMCAATSMLACRRTGGPSLRPFSARRGTGGGLARPTCAAANRLPRAGEVMLGLNSWR